MIDSRGASKAKRLTDTERKELILRLRTARKTLLSACAPRSSVLLTAFAFGRARAKHSKDILRGDSEGLLRSVTGASQAFLDATVIGR